MKWMALTSVALGLIVTSAAPLLASCDLAASAIAQSYCPCDASGGGAAWRNHAAYVSCVQTNLASIVRVGGTEARCRQTLFRSAASSVCGRPGAVVCVRGNKCSVAPSADRCTAKGGTGSTARSCAG